MYSDLNDCYVKCINLNKEIVNLPSKCLALFNIELNTVHAFTCTVDLGYM